MPPTALCEQKAAPNVSMVRSVDDLPTWMDTDDLTEFLHENMKPFEDPLPAVQIGVEFALSDEPGKGGFVLLATDSRRVIGAVVVVKTGLRDCVPESLVLYASVRPSHRGQGIGKNLLETALHRCNGDVTLHVEPHNPARRLYERLGFENKYVDMRYCK